MSDRPDLPVPSDVTDAQPDCPHCLCCSARLCETARACGTECVYMSQPATPTRVSPARCPCAAVAAAHRALQAAAAIDPSHPLREAVAPRHQDIVDEAYAARTRRLLDAAHYLVMAGYPVGITEDPGEPGYTAVLTIELAPGQQVTWHLPTEDPPGAYGLPPGKPWDGHDSVIKYARLSQWLALTPRPYLPARADYWQAAGRLDRAAAECDRLATLSAGLPVGKVHPVHPHVLRTWAELLRENAVLTRNVGPGYARTALRLADQILAGDDTQGSTR